MALAQGIVRVAMPSTPRRIVIVGAGFAGIWAALGAAAEREASATQHAIDITVVAPGEFLLIRPRLYERDLRGTRVPLYGVLPQVRVGHVDAMVDQIDMTERRVHLLGIGIEHQITYDQLVICAGSRRAVRLDRPHQHGVDTYQEAQALRAYIDADSSERPRVAVIGSNFTGLEVATELAAHADVQLVEQGHRVAPEFGPAARAVIEEAIDKLDIDVRLNTVATPDDNHWGVDGDATVWATGPHAANISWGLGLGGDEFGRIPVDPQLSTAVDGVWAAGDCARAQVDKHHLAPMSCQHAMPMGARAGANAVRAALGMQGERYSQPLYLTCLDLGGAGALLTAGFERDEVIATGESAKQFKRYINRHLIYPPTGDADALLKLGAAEPPGAAAVTLVRRALRSSILRASLTKTVHDRAADHLTT
jgi:NADH dehydrogenase